MSQADFRLLLTVVRNHIDEDLADGPVPNWTARVATENISTRGKSYRPGSIP